MSYNPHAYLSYEVDIISSFILHVRESRPREEKKFLLNKKPARCTAGVWIQVFQL
jgi:hypothetical protein